MCISLSVFFSGCSASFFVFGLPFSSVLLSWETLLCCLLTRDQSRPRQRWFEDEADKKQQRKRRADGKGGKKKQNWICRYGFLDICLCPFAVLFFTFPHACSLFSSSALPLFSLECHWPESGRWWLSSVFSSTPLTRFIPLSIYFYWSIHLDVFLLFVHSLCCQHLFKTVHCCDGKKIRSLALRNDARSFCCIIHNNEHFFVLYSSHSLLWRNIFKACFL